LKAKYNRKYDKQRALCEDPIQINAWFRLVEETIQKYGIVPEDIYNFDETGFAMGIAATSRVVTSSDQRNRPNQVQPGNREWVTAIEAINATGWALPPMIIFKGKLHLSSWYHNPDIPIDWTLAVSDNRWTTDKLGLTWITDVFEPNTAARTVGKYRLLILDGHSSHATPEFDQFCENHSIITLCMPPHSSHLLQPLDVGCFSPLKRGYGRRIAENIILGIDHIDKVEFLSIFREARAGALSSSNICSGFRATGLVPLDPDEVLSRLQIREPESDSPSIPAASNQTQWEPKTPYNITDLERQVGVIQNCLKQRSQNPPTPTNQVINQLVKGFQMALHNTTILAHENEKLRAINERRKRTRNQTRSTVATGGTLTIAQGRERIVQQSTQPTVVAASNQVVRQATTSATISAITPAPPTRSTIATGSTITQGQEHTRPTQQVVAPNRVVRRPATSGPSTRLPSCYICYAFDHIASACPQGQESVV
jgi:hypothetical protein